MKYKLKIQYTPLYHSLGPARTNEAHKITHSRLEYIRLIRSTAWVSNLFMAKRSHPLLWAHSLAKWGRKKCRFRACFLSQQIDMQVKELLVEPTNLHSCTGPAFEPTN